MNILKIKFNKQYILMKNKIIRGGVIWELVKLS